jgi:hypothetical protein
LTWGLSGVQLAVTRGEGMEELTGGPIVGVGERTARISPRALRAQRKPRHRQPSPLWGLAQLTVLMVVVATVLILAVS